MRPPHYNEACIIVSDGVVRRYVVGLRSFEHAKAADEKGQVHRRMPLRENQT